MPWKDVLPMEERIRFAVLAAKGTEVFSDLCEQFGISRKTGYKWLKRYREFGLAGTREWSRRPERCPHRTPAKIEALILRERRRHRSWGPKKLRELLRTGDAVAAPPSRATIAKILRRHGLAGKGGRRRRPGRIAQCGPGALTQPHAANAVWTVDYKGWFRLGDGARCDPLTVTDLFSRYLLCLRAVPAATQACTRRAFFTLFRLFGLPAVIRVDNGTPFASMGLAGLSKLSVWWVGLGIQVEFIRPASPYQNGSHERMHKTLKAEATQPPSPNRRAQQRRFVRWRHQFNHERPHEALGMKKPAQVYQPSARRYDGRDIRIDYPAGFRVQKATANGCLRWKGHVYFVGEAFAHARLGLRENARGETELFLANLCLGTLHLESQGRLRPTASVVPGSPAPPKP
jgi:transposase InsO family protein